MFHKMEEPQKKINLQAHVPSYFFTRVSCPFFKHVCVTEKKEGHFKVGSPEKLWPLPPWVFHLVNKSSTATRLHVGPWHSSVAPKNGWMRRTVEIRGKNSCEFGWILSWFLRFMFSVLQRCSLMVGRLFLVYFFSFMGQLFLDAFKLDTSHFDHR